MEIKLHRQMTEAEAAELYRAGRAEGALTVVAYDARRLDLTPFEAFARRAEVFGAVYEGGIPQGFFYLTDFEGAAAREEQRRAALEALAAESRRAALAEEELRREKQAAADAWPPARWDGVI